MPTQEYAGKPIVASAARTWLAPNSIRDIVSAPRKARAMSEASDEAQKMGLGPTTRDCSGARTSIDDGQKCTIVSTTELATATMAAEDR